MLICPKCGAENVNNDTGYCKFCLATLEPASSQNEQRDNIQNRQSDTKSINEGGQTSSRGNPQSGTMVESRKDRPVSDDMIYADKAEDTQTENISLPEKPQRDEPLFEIKEVDFDHSATNGLGAADMGEDNGFNEGRYFKDAPEDKIDFDPDSIDMDTPIPDDDDIRIAMEQTENGPEITLGNQSDFSTTPEILPQEAPVIQGSLGDDYDSLDDTPIISNDNEPDYDDEESPLTQKIIINPQVEQKKHAENGLENGFTNNSTAPPPQETSFEKPKTDKPFHENDDDLFGINEGPKIDEEVIARANQTPKPTSALGIAYFDGKAISFIGGFKPSAGDNVFVNEKGFILREKPPSILAKMPKPVLYGIAGLVLVILAFMAISLGPTDNGQITGMLINPSTKAPVSNATITIKELNKSVQTSYAGFFVFEDIKPGSYTVILEDEGVGILSEQLTVYEGKTSTISLSLPVNQPISSTQTQSREVASKPPPPPKELKPGFMKLTLSPSKGKVYYDGEYIGRGTQTFKVPAGQHRVTVKQSGYKSKSFTVKIPEDQIKPYKVTLNKVKGSKKNDVKSEAEIAADLEQDGKFSEALKKYKLLLSQNKTDIEAVLGKGRCLKAIGQEENALTIFLDAVKISTDQKDMDTQLEALDGVLSINPNYLTARYRRGLIFLDQEQYFRAAQDFSKVVEIDRRHLNGYYKLGEAYYKGGNYNNAIAAYEKIQEFNFADTKPYVYITKSYLKLDDRKNAKKYYDKFEKSADQLTKNEFRNDAEWQKIKVMFD